MNIIKKAQEWATAYGSILNVSAETRLPWLYKGAVGGLEHVISADNGGAYIELWRDGTGSYYATTGAKITQMPGLAKGAKLDEALDKFFALTAKFAKARRWSITASACPTRAGRNFPRLQRASSKVRHRQGRGSSTLIIFTLMAQWTSR